MYSLNQKYIENQFHLFNQCAITTPRVKQFFSDVSH